MDRLMRGRRPVRTQLTRIIKEINDLLALEAPDQKTLKINHDVLVKTMDELEVWDIKVKNQLIDDASAEDIVDEEFKNIEKYRRSFLTTLSDVESKMGPRDENPTETGSVMGQSKKRKFHLPEVKLKTFGGNLKDWLGWWSQYEKIHNDVDLHDTDKFHYLCQGMEPGTEAKELIDSYPQTEENYKKAIEALRERYGRQDLLLQVYVRELLTLVISNVTSKDKLSLSQLYLRLESHLRSLAALNLDKADPATWLYPLVESSLSEETLRAWQRSAQSKLEVVQVADGEIGVPAKTRLENLMEFIKLEVQSEQQITLAQQGFQASTPPLAQKKAKSRLSYPKIQDDVPTAAGLVAIQATTGCGFCGFKNHETEKCFKAQRMTMKERNMKIRDKRLCFKCLRPGHLVNKCRISVKCSICQGPHYQVMCPKLDTEKHKRFRGSSDELSIAPAKRIRSDRNNEVLKSTDSSSFNQGSNQCARNILLNTLKVKVRDVSGNMTTVRVLCDSGSQRSYALSRTIQKICCQHLDDEWIQNILFGGELTVPKKYHRYAVNLFGGNGNEMQFQLLEKNKISGDIPEIRLGSWQKQFQQQGITFSDIGNGSSEAEILIGNDYWGAVRTGRMVKLDNGLCAEETVFGWVLGGPVNIQASNAMISSCVTVSSQDIEKLWSLEALGIKDPVEVKTNAEEERMALEHFALTVKRTENGRYVVSLPWKDDHNELPTNRRIAEQRLRSTTYKLNKTNKLSNYDAVFKVWEKEGIIHRVPDCDSGHFIPHRPVYKDSTTTPVRPVFDASCKQGRLPSLNECLHKGPNLIELIPTLLLRFGAKKVGVSADIRKAFQMIMVNEDDQPYQRFLWWEDESCKRMVVYEHQRVVFGITSSPFLLGATINHHLKNCEDNEMSDVLLNSFYVDNLVMSVGTKEEYENLRKRATKTLAGAQMELRQWASSAKKSTTNQDSADYPEKIIPVLGILWNTADDYLSCVIKNFKIDGEITKRNMLSVMAQVFDPVGYLCPAMILPKMLVQEQWSKKTEWDTPVPTETKKKFLRWAKEIQYLKEVKVPRFCQQIRPSVKEVHIFCDSSRDAMAAVAFMRTEVYGEVLVQFLMAKARLTPVRKPSIPRAELTSCVIGNRIGNTIREALDLPMLIFVFWCDASTALAWIRRAGDWGVFVRNRVNEILKTSTAEQWRHVPGTMNPADLPSRGCSPSSLVQSKWWEGPPWLQGPSSGFPNAMPLVDEAEVISETKKAVVMTNTVVAVQPRFSSYRKNIAVWGWVLRFVSCLRGKKINVSFLTIDELRLAEKLLLKQIQNDVFPVNCKEVGGVQVQRDGDGILRVRSRLVNRKDSEDFIYPILLPKSHPLVEQLIRDVHLFHGHGGVQFLLSKIRQKYWIMQSRRVVRRIVRACVKCRRHVVKNLEVEPAALPEKRVTSSEVYATTGVDLAGPLFLKDSKKAWIVLYTCAVYRCVELDLVTSLSTEAFLGSLERFVSTHGRPNTIYSDNGTNFVGAVNLFRQVNWKEVEEHCNVKQIQWIFNPPTAAWWGGFWERMVRSVKDLLKRILGRSKLSYDELRTCLAGVAATINDRPLTVVTEDNMDLVPLTPVMFTRLCGNGHFPELSTADQLSSSYKKMKELQGSLQARFRKEYLSLLVTRSGKKQQQAVKVGDVVLVGADNRKRFEWPLGVVMELCPGKDGNVRVVNVKTATSVLERPLQRIFPLEVTQQQSLSLKEKAQDFKKADEPVTKFGRVVKRPVRYGQWLHLIK